MFLDSLFGIDILGDGDPDALDDAILMEMIETDEESEQDPDEELGRLWPWQN